MKLAWDLSGVGLKSNSRAPKDRLLIVYSFIQFCFAFSYVHWPLELFFFIQIYCYWHLWAFWVLRTSLFSRVLFFFYFCLFFLKSVVLFKLPCIWPGVVVHTFNFSTRRQRPAYLCEFKTGLVYLVILVWPGPCTETLAKRKKKVRNKV